MSAVVPSAAPAFAASSHVARSALALAALAILGALLPVAVGEGFLLYVATLVALYAVGAMSCHLVMRLGQLTLGHAAFLGVGGYASALLVTSCGIDWWLATPAGAALAGLAGLVVGPVALRLKGVYFALFTFALGEFVRQLFTDAVGVTGGSEGVSAIPSPPGFSTPTSFYYLVLGVSLAVGCFCGRLLQSQFGDAVDAIRESESLARSNGIPVFKVKVTVFALACALVAVQGALEASMVHYVSPLSYGFQESLRFVVINVVGGLNSLWGPVLGSVFVVALPELLRGSVDYQWILYGAVLILLMKYLPGGLIDLGAGVRAAAKRARRRR